MCIWFGFLCCFTSCLAAQLTDYERALLAMIPGCSAVSEQWQAQFDGAPGGDYHDGLLVQDDTTRGDRNPLFKAYPALSNSLSYIALGNTPSPVISCDYLGTQFPAVRLYIKNDGKLGQLDTQGVRAFGGNKVRKLQYLLADARAHGHDTVLTFGCAGSNHALQTAVCAQQFGLAAICMLKPQPNTQVVRRNLLLQVAVGAQLYFSENNTQRCDDTLALCLRCKQHNGQLPYIIPTGGSCSRGAIGYVEAALELKEQIDAGLLPTPDHIYVTCGSYGTTAGLLLGLQAAGISTQVHAVLCEPTSSVAARAQIRTLFEQTNELLLSYDPSFPWCPWEDTRCDIVSDFAGEAYGVFTPAGVAAAELLQDTEHIRLDGVYTAKCFSALLAQLRDGTLDGTTVLFWDTFCAEDMSNITNTIDYHDLPRAFHQYFEQPVQPLDCD